MAGLGGRFRQWLRDTEGSVVVLSTTTAPLSAWAKAPSGPSSTPRGRPAR